MAGTSKNRVTAEIANRISADTKIEMPPINDVLHRHPKVDAGIWTPVQTSTWKAHCNDYTALSPESAGGEVIMAFLKHTGSW